MRYELINNLIYEDENILVVNKVSNMPTVPLKNSNEGNSLLDVVSDYCPQVKSFAGYSEHEGGVLHRLDTPTTGLVLIAKNRSSFEFLREKQKEDLFIKKYLVKSISKKSDLPGFGDFPFKDPKNEKQIKIKSLFRHYGRGRTCVRPVLETYSSSIISKASNKYYETTVVFEKEKDDINYFTCSLTNGFRHQIRVHMAWSGYPLVGDVLYGAPINRDFGLDCFEMTFLNPYTLKEQTVTKKDIKL